MKSPHGGEIPLRPDEILLRKMKSCLRHGQSVKKVLSNSHQIETGGVYAGRGAILLKERLRSGKKNRFLADFLPVSR